MVCEGIDDELLTRVVCDGTNRTLLELTTQRRTQQLPEVYVKVVLSAVLTSILLISTILNQLSTVAHDPGQQFVVDVFTHLSVGTSGFIYAHLFTDLSAVP